MSRSLQLTTVRDILMDNTESKLWSIKAYDDNSICHENMYQCTLKEAVSMVKKEYGGHYIYLQELSTTTSSVDFRKIHTPSLENQKYPIKSLFVNGVKF